MTEMESNTIQPEIVTTIEAMVQAAVGQLEHVRVDATVFLALCEQCPAGHTLRKFFEAHQGRTRPLSIGRLTLQEALTLAGYVLPQ